jgi:hypothetical protein
VTTDKVKLFVNDTNLFVSYSNMVTFGEWFLANKLTINTLKAWYMVLSSRNQGQIKMSVNSMVHSKVSAHKYLGVTLDQELQWREHTEAVDRKLINFAGIICKLRNKLPSPVLQTIYYVFCLPPYLI